MLDARDDAPADPELWACYVSDTAWGTGVSGRLLGVALPGSAYLWVLRGNARAIAFYRKQGFALDGATKQDARIDADELRMTRR